MKGGRNHIYHLAHNPKYACVPARLTAPGSVFFSRGQIAWILANSFLGTLKDPGHLRWDKLNYSQTVEARERLSCLYDYFERVEKAADLDAIVTFSLIKVPIWAYPQDTVLSVERVTLHNDPMEAPVAAGAIVDFANRNIHIHSIIPSLTQEEILFSTYSECFMTLVCFPNALQDDEVVLVQGAWRHSTYSGYAETFQYVGPCPSTIIQDVIVMDAPMSGQFDLIDRDVGKAIAGFSATSSNCISTGKWGCGAFGGDVALKFLEQVIAAQVANKSIYFSTFGNETEANMVSILVGLIKTAKPSVEWLVRKIKAFKKGSFYLYIREQLELQQMIQQYWDKE